MQRDLARSIAFTASLFALPLLPTAAMSQIVVSANDGKAVLVNGVNTVPANPAPDNIAVIDLNASPPKVLAEIKAPTSVVGPPNSVAVSRDESIAIVTASTKLNPADPKKLVPGTQVSVIDLKANPPALVTTFETGAGARSVVINPAGTLALICNYSEGTVSVYTISGKTLTLKDKVRINDGKSTPSGIAISPDGKTALVTRDSEHKISVLSIDGDKVEYTKRDIQAGLRPNSVDISSRGDVAVNGNIGMGGGDADTVSLIDLAAKPARVVDTVTAAQTPETVKISPDGAYVAVAAHNGSGRPDNSPFFNDHGLLLVFAIQGKKLVKVAETKSNRWCQGIAWSKDGRTILLQCMVGNEIQMFGFDGKELKVTGGIKVSAGPGGIGAAQ